MYTDIVHNHYAKIAIGNVKPTTSCPQNPITGGNMSTYASQALIYGTSTAEPDRQTFDLGDMSLLWQEGSIRRLCYQETEIVRGISAVIRDRNWGTHHPLTVASWHYLNKNDLTLEHTFQIREGDVATGKCWINGSLEVILTDLTINITLVLHALEDFTTCRSGLSVLLPLHGVVGAPIDVVHTDGHLESGHFPDRISPSQPFVAIRSLHYAPTATVAVGLEFTGDIFEMEDQRNWSDASFKVYNRPLAWPTPYNLKAGQRIEQRLTVWALPKTTGGGDG